MGYIRSFLKTKFINNFSWIVVGRVYQILINLVVSMLSARYLGPSNYGLINYVTSYTSLFTAFCTLGTNDTVVNELMGNRESEGKLIGTTIFSRICAGILSVVTVTLLIKNIDPGEPLTLWVALVYSTTLIFQSFETIKYWYQSLLRSKTTSIISIIAYTVVAVYKIILLIFKKSVVWFAAANAVDYAVIAVMFVIAYMHDNGKNQPLSVSFKIGIPFLKKSYHYIISGTMVALYGQMDKIMIGKMMNEEDVGYYSAAIVIYTMWAFVLSALIDSARTVIIPLFKKDKKLYEKRLVQLYCAIIYVSFAVAALIVIFAKPIIYILYGEHYLPATNALRVVAWSAAFSYLGVARNIWLVQNGQQKYEKHLALIGVLCNLVMNYFFIKLWGICGAAAATLLTQIITNCIAGFFFKSIRRNNVLVLKAFNIFAVAKDFLAQRKSGGGGNK